MPWRWLVILSYVRHGNTLIKLPDIEEYPKLVSEFLLITWVRTIPEKQRISPLPPRSWNSCRSVVMMARYNGALIN